MRVNSDNSDILRKINIGEIYAKPIQSEQLYLLINSSYNFKIIGVEKDYFRKDCDKVIFEPVGFPDLPHKYYWGLSRMHDFTNEVDEYIKNHYFIR